MGKSTLASGRRLSLFLFFVLSIFLTATLNGAEPFDYNSAVQLADKTGHLPFSQEKRIYIFLSSTEKELPFLKGRKTVDIGNSLRALTYSSDDIKTLSDIWKIFGTYPDEKWRFDIYQKNSPTKPTYSKEFTTREEFYNSKQTLQPGEALLCTRSDEPNNNPFSPRNASNEPTKKIERIALQWMIHHGGPLAEEMIKTPAYFYVTQSIPNFANATDKIWEIRLSDFARNRTRFVWVNEKTCQVLGFGFDKE
jgi:hypothetical protein